MAHEEVNYYVLEANNKDSLCEKVVTYIENDWVPTGGVTIVNLGDGNLLYAQAVTLYVRDSDR